MSEPCRLITEEEYQALLFDELAYKEAMKINAEICDLNDKLATKCHSLEQQREQAVTLIKDGRFVEALNVLDPKWEM